MRKHSRIRFGLLLLVASAVGTASAQAVAQLPTTAPADKVCVAVLEPEVQADLQADQRKALAGVLDTLLTERLAGRKEFTLVDRQALGKVLAEKIAGAAGLIYTRRPVGIGDTLWMVACPDSSCMRGTRIIGFQPGWGEGPDRTPDRWVGPLESPDGTSILNLTAVEGGRLAVATQKANYLVSGVELIQAADNAGLIYETQPGLPAAHGGE